MSECNCKACDKRHSKFQHEKRPIVSLRDKGHSVEYRYINESKNHLAKYRIDGGLISDNGARCDFLLLNCEQRQAYFIELKGSHLEQSMKQIDRSIDLLKGNLSGFAIFARIILSHVKAPALRSSSFAKLQKKVKSLKGDLKQVTTSLEEIK